MIPKYIIDLDLAPHKRWLEVVKDHKDACKEVIAIMDKTFMSSTLTETLLTGLVKLYKTYGAILYQKELESISEELGISFEKIILMQLCYEMSACCTSAIFKFNDEYVHYRTMDWSMDFLKKLTVELDFQKNNKTLFKATSWVGYIGILTGMSNNHSIALNYRKSNGTLLGNATRALQMYYPAGYAIRTVFEKNYDYDTSLEYLSKVNLIAPCYFTLCSSSNKLKPLLIIRDPTTCVDIIKNKVIIQTNKDPNNNNYNILYSIERSKLAEKIIKEKIGLCKTYKDIYDAFDKFPIINHDTIYINIMDPSNKEYLSYNVTKNISAYVKDYTNK